MAQEDEGLFEQLRNSVIQCFEFTYELSHKMLKRYLEETAPNPEEIDFSTFQNLIRTGNEKGLLRSDWLRWKEYRQARTNSSHTYDESKAEAFYGIASDFLVVTTTSAPLRSSFGAFSLPSGSHKPYLPPPQKQAPPVFPTIPEKIRMWRLPVRFSSAVIKFPTSAFAPNTPRPNQSHH